MQILHISPAIGLTQCYRQCTLLPGSRAWLIDVLEPMFRLQGLLASQIVHGIAARCLDPVSHSSRWSLGIMPRAKLSSRLNPTRLNFVGRATGTLRLVSTLASLSNDAAVLEHRIESMWASSPKLEPERLGTLKAEGTLFFQAPAS